MSWRPVIEGLREAARLIATGDREVVEITFRSIQTASFATLLATLIGLPLGVALGMRDFRGKRFVKIFFNGLVGIPTVTLGLLLWTLFSRSGPLGFTGLLYTVPGIAVGEAVLIVPIIVSFVVSAIEAKDVQLRDLVRTLGASEFETSVAILREAYAGVSLAIVSGANIKGLTRVLTTTIALQKDMGDIGLSFALSFILLLVVMSLNFVMGLLRRGD
jgi:tungstate transport system permease protein